jgi:hypothetical protein
MRLYAGTGRCEVQRGHEWPSSPLIDAAKPAGIATAIVMQKLEAWLISKSRQTHQNGERSWSVSVNKKVHSHPRSLNITLLCKAAPFVTRAAHFRNQDKYAQISLPTLQ